LVKHVRQVADGKSAWCFAAAALLFRPLPLDYSTIVMSPGFAGALRDGDKVVKTFVAVHDVLAEAGETRYPFVNFAEAG
jgi:hypothetical protein